MIVEFGVLELREVECGRVLHQSNAHAVREQVAEQAFDELRRAAKRVAADGDRELDSDEQRQIPPVGSIRPRPNDFVDDQLSDPERRDGDEGAHDPQHGGGEGKPAIGLPDEGEQRRDIAHRGEALTPGEALGFAVCREWSAGSHPLKGIR